MPRGFLRERKKIFKKSKKDEKNVLTKAKQCAIISRSQDDLGVAQLVARYLGVVEAASSSLVTQTRKSQMGIARLAFSVLCDRVGLAFRDRPAPRGAGWLGSERKKATARPFLRSDPHKARRMPSQGRRQSTMRLGRGNASSSRIEESQMGIARLAFSVLYGRLDLVFRDRPAPRGAGWLGSERKKAT